MSVAIITNQPIPSNQDHPLLLLQSPPQPSDQTRRSMRTLLDLLTVDKLDGLDNSLAIHPDRDSNNSNNNNNNSDSSNSNSNSNSNSRWRVLKERLGLGFCGVDLWRFRFGGSADFPEDSHEHGGGGGGGYVDDIVVVEMSSRENNEEIVIDTRQQTDSFPVESHTNLATALAAERDNRGNNEEGGGDETPSRVSLMRLLEETAEDGGGVNGEVGGVEEEVGSDSVCCVCINRKKGAALIPCGHTYCRVCSREVWLNRGSCPLCNQPILEILDIF